MRPVVPGLGAHN